MVFRQWPMLFEKYIYCFKHQCSQSGTTTSTMKASRFLTGVLLLGVWLNTANAAVLPAKASRGPALLPLPAYVPSREDLQRPAPPAVNEDSGSDVLVEIPLCELPADETPVAPPPPSGNGGDIAVLPGVVRPQPKPMPLPEVVPQPLPMPLPEVVPQPKPMPLPEVVPQPKPVPLPEVVPQPKPLPEVVPQPKPLPEVVPQPKPLPEVVPQPKPMPLPEVVPQPKPMPLPEVVPQPKPLPGVVGPKPKPLPLPIQPEVTNPIETKPADVPDFGGEAEIPGPIEIPGVAVDPETPLLPGISRPGSGKPLPGVVPSPGGNNGGVLLPTRPIRPLPGTLPDNSGSGPVSPIQPDASLPVETLPGQLPSGNIQLPICQIPGTDQIAVKPAPLPELPGGRPNLLPGEIPEERPNKLPVEVPKETPNTLPAEIPKQRPNKLPAYSDTVGVLIR